MVGVVQNLMWLSLVWMTSAYAGLEVKINKTQSLLGEPLVLQIKSASDLGELNLAPIAQNFELASQTLNRVTRAGQTEYLLEATLYPLRSGVVSIPSLVLGTQRSRALDIRILPAPFSIQTWFPPEMPMVREATILHLVLRDDGSINWDTPIQINSPYTVIRALPESIHEEVQGNVKNTVRHLRWQILPLREGSITIDFGMLDAHRYAQRLRFPAGKISFNVRPAPAYLPLNLPIGRPIIRTDPKPLQLVVGKLQAWNMYVSAPGLSTEGLKSLLQYKVPGGIVLYSPSITPVIFGNDEYLRVTLSYKAERGASAFPSIHVPYFDKRTQRIEKLTLPATSLQVRDIARERMLFWSAAAIGFCMFAFGFWSLWRHWQRRKTRRQWLGRIMAAQTPVELYRQLTKYSPWQSRTPRALPRDLDIKETQFAELDALRFGQKPPNRLSVFKTELVSLLARTPIKIYPQNFLQG